MRFSTPCSRIRSSAGEISSSSFSFSLSSAAASKDAAPGRISPAPTLAARKASLRRVIRLRSIACCPVRRRHWRQGYISLRGRIDSQYFHQISYLSQMSQCVASRLVITPKDIHVEDVLPRSSAHRPGFDLAQTDVTEREDA